METRVGLAVMVTANVTNEKASKDITAATGRARAEDSGRDRGAVSSLMTEWGTSGLYGIIRAPYYRVFPFMEAPLMP